MIIKMSDVEEVAGVSQGAIHVSVSNYRTHNGKTPEWYIKTSKGYFVDTDLMFQKSRIEHESWNWATDTEGLYFALKLYLNDTQLSRKLAVRSHIFKSATSWHQFLSTSMWNISATDVIRVSSKKTAPMIVEAIRHMMDILYGLIKRFGIREWEGV